MCALCETKETNRRYLANSSFISEARLCVRFSTSEFLVACHLCLHGKESCDPVGVAAEPYYTTTHLKSRKLNPIAAEKSKKSVK